LRKSVRVAAPIIQTTPTTRRNKPKGHSTSWDESASNTKTSPITTKTSARITCIRFTGAMYTRFSLSNYPSRTAAASIRNVRGLQRIKPAPRSCDCPVLEMRSAGGGRGPPLSLAVGRWRADGELAAPASHVTLCVCIAGAQDHGTDGGGRHALRTLPPAAHTAAETSLPHPPGPARDLVRRILDVRARPGGRTPKSGIHASTSSTTSW